MDVSELQGLWMECLEGCALCCLCQPALSGRENRRFAKDPRLKKGITKRSITGEKGSNYSIKLKGGKGSCYFLKDRRCTIYADRPFYCRAFPIHIHAGDRIQAVANLSCRGMNTEGRGRPASELANDVMELAKEYKMTKGLGQVQEAYASFTQDYLQGMSSPSREALQGEAASVLARFGFRDFIKRAMAFSSIESDVPSDITPAVPFLEDLGSPDVAHAAVQGALDTFGSEDLAKLPVWNDAELTWLVCRLTDGSVERCQMGEDGGLKILQKLALDDIGLRDIDDAALQLLQEYSEKVIMRDLTFGYAAYMKIMTEDSDPFLKIYLGILGTILLDLWWRASLLAAFDGKEIIDRESAAYGIIAYDMDFLDLPSLGGFI